MLMAKGIIKSESKQIVVHIIKPSDLAVNISVKGGRGVEQDDQVALHKVDSLLYI